MIFRPKSEIQTFFSPKIRWSPKKKKKRSSPKLRVIFRPKSEIQTFFSPKIVRLRLVGEDASRNGTVSIEIEADFSAKIVTFRLVGGCIPPILPLNPPLLNTLATTVLVRFWNPYFSFLILGCRIYATQRTG